MSGANFLDGKVTLLKGDCLELLKGLPENSIDSVVTDPPYHLTSIVKRFGGDNAAPAQIGKTGAYARASAGFMGRKWDAPDAPAIDPAFAGWFSGFVDGEGCFHVHKKTVNGCETYDCQFSLTLRADDRAIVEEIQEQLGGIGSIAMRPAPKTGNGKPQVRYCVSSQRDCQRLREVLSAFPLRAKKLRDFEIWSHALDAWVAHEPKESWEEVAYFRDKLMAVRQYGAAYHPSQLFYYRFARECMRVLKPGGHLVAFGGTRTYHRLAMAIEDAGFEVRDQLGFCFGSGFPKSHDVSKGIDKKANELPLFDAIRTHIREWRDRAGMTNAQLNSALGLATNGCGMARHWTSEEGGQHMIPSKEQWLRLKAVLAWPNCDLDIVYASVKDGAERPVIGRGKAVFNEASAWSKSLASDYDITAPATDSARQWQGWGTALKPAWEPICLARKPLIGTVAENVLQHGVGALNIDGCRIHADDAKGYEYTVARTMPGAGQHKTGERKQQGVTFTGVTKDGRWPANIVHDGSAEVLAAFPDSDVSGSAKAGRPTSRIAGDHVAYSHGTNAPTDTVYHNDSGSAARFFYTAKADTHDRLGSKHPTVKPLDLMQWLVRLVTPKGGMVLDPFAGTGTTGEAAWREGCRAILIEREAEYQADIERRMELALNPTKRAAIAASKNNLDRPEDLPLFASVQVAPAKDAAE